MCISLFLFKLLRKLLELILTQDNFDKYLFQPKVNFTVTFKTTYSDNLMNPVKTTSFLSCILVLFFAVLACIQVSAQQFKETFIDTTDNAVDVSNFLNSVSGFMPVPAIITEPAVGYGGGLGILYFHKKKKIMKKENTVFYRR